MPNATLRCAYWLPSDGSRILLVEPSTLPVATLRAVAMTRLSEQGMDPMSGEIVIEVIGSTTD